MTADRTTPNRTRSVDGRLAVGDRIANRKEFGWQKTRTGTIFKFSPSGGLAHVEWDDRLGPQVVIVGDIVREGEE